METKNWDCPETSTPISDIRNLLLKSREVNGEKYENPVICMSTETFIKCFNSKEVKDLVESLGDRFLTDVDKVNSVLERKKLPRLKIVDS